MTTRNYERDFKSCARVPVVAMPHNLWMLLSAQGRSGAWKYQACCSVRWDGGKARKCNSFPFRSVVLCLGQPASFSWDISRLRNAISSFLGWACQRSCGERNPPERKAAEGLARHPARSCCSGSISPWQTSGFFTVSRVLLWKSDCVCSCTSWPPK